MKKINTFVLVTILLSTTAVKAENHMLIMGGGGEPAGSTTIFDSTMKFLGDNLKSTNWKYNVSFNGGHTATEAMMRTQFPHAIAPITPFTAEAYKNMISEYKAKILMGEIKSGDQIIVMLSTHGAANTGGDTKTHQIAVSGGNATTDLNNLKGTPVVSVDDLEELVKLTNEKGIKLGIVDLSCYSGNTMALKKNAPNTCIITATGPKHYGYAGGSAFTGRFIKNLKKGESLESIFLKSRAESTDPAYPMISTDESDQIVAEVYAAITPFLYYYDPKADKLSDYLIANSADCVSCTSDIQFKALIDKIDKLKSASSGRSPGFNGDELKRLLTNYKSAQDNIIRQSQALGVGMLDKSESFTGEGSSTKGKKTIVEKFSLKLNWSEIILAEPDNVIKSITASNDKEKDPGTIATTLAAVETWKKVKEKQTEILSKFPQIKDVKEQGKRLAASIGENRAVADKISLQERVFYDELYKQKQSLNTNDPCRKIIF
ncbi:MAG: hypothetical protein H7336_07955 [Bacteriovorax sp.]|nr:hypothetical protein [Bacteriovorax sp.]